MSNINELLNNILNEEFGENVRAAIKEGLEEIDGKYPEVIDKYYDHAFNAEIHVSPEEKEVWTNMISNSKIFRDIGSGLSDEELHDIMFAEYYRER